MWNLEVVEKETFRAFQKQITEIVKQVDGRHIAVWGASVRGMIAGMILEELGIRQFDFIDNDVARQGSNLAGHTIVSFDSSKRDWCIIVSMEIHEEVKKQLISADWKEKKDFFCLYSTDTENILRELESAGKEVLLLGASCIHVLPVEERNEKDLSDLLKEKYGDKLKVIGVTCLGMKQTYYMACIEMLQNVNLQEILLIVSWETLTDFHHILPRTQKVQLMKCLANYSKNVDEELSNKIDFDCEIAQRRSENFLLENKYSVQYTEKDIGEEQALKTYLEQGFMKDLDLSCEEVFYLEQILKKTEERKIFAKVILEPVDKEKCRKLYGSFFDGFYRNKCTELKKIVELYNGEFWDASNLLSSDKILSHHLAGEAFYKEGRKEFASFIVDKMR